MWCLSIPAWSLLPSLLLLISLPSSFAVPVVSTRSTTGIVRDVKSWTTDGLVDTVDKIKVRPDGRQRETCGCLCALGLSPDSLKPLTMHP